MLWRYSREQIVKAVLAIARQRGLEVKKVYSLSSGLWVSVQLVNGHIINIQDYEIQRTIDSFCKNSVKLTKKICLEHLGQI